MTQKNTGKTGNDPLRTLKLILIIALALVALITMIKSCNPVHATETGDMYEVEVKARLGNSYTTVKQIVQAKNSFDAQERAMAQVRYKITLSVKRYQKLN